METIPQKIERRAQEIGINPDIALEIARCESRFKADAKNPYSSASGVFQFISSTWRDTIKGMNLPAESDVFDENINIEAGLWLLNKDGTVHWIESKDCWGPKVGHLSLR